jgi:hypothetical protein
MSNRNEAQNTRDYQARHIPENSFHMLDHPQLASDLLEGVREIAMFIHGTMDKPTIRSVYHRTETSNTIPTFKLGAMTCARKSAIRATIWMQEKRTWKSDDQELLVRVNMLLNNILTLIEPHHHANDNRNRAELSLAVAEAMKTIHRLLHIGGM